MFHILYNILKGLVKRSSSLREYKNEKEKGKNFKYEKLTVSETFITINLLGVIPDLPLNSNI